MQNRDFLFLYDAALCNPNGDPDQENRPRMDESTNTNLVSDVRIKRYIRDHWKAKGHAIFVDMVGDAKVTMEDRMAGVLVQLIDNKERLASILAAHTEEKAQLEQIVDRLKDTDKVVAYLMTQKADAKTKKELPGKNEVSAINAALLAGLVAQEYIDIRSFGSALAVPGFNRAITGPIQMGWGYSLNEVFLLDSKTIASIMNDGNSTFGRDFRLKYSLLGFIGTINRQAAQYTGLTEEDLQLFRDGLWDGIAAQPTRTKLNQYPKLYLEIVYAEGVSNGQLGDMRKLIQCRPAIEKEAEQVASLADLELNFSVLLAAIEDAKKTGLVDQVVVRSSFDFPNRLIATLEASA